MSMILELHAANDDAIGGLLDGDPETTEAFLSEGGTSIDKAWDGIHFALTGKGMTGGSGTMSYEPFGNRYLDAVDAGYGPATYLAPEETAIVARHLKGISADDFAALVNADAMRAAEVYPIQPTETDADVRAFLAPAFEEMRAFYLDAASRGLSVVTVMK